MHYRLAIPPMLWILLCPVVLHAEEGFYQEIDHNGHVRTISIPQKPGIEGVIKEEKEAMPPGVKTSKPAELVPVPPLEVEVEAKTTGKFAPYNSDEYLDSDHLEASGFNPEKKSRFYIVNDGMTSRVEENLEGDATGRAEKIVQAEEVVKGVDLPSERDEITDKALIMSVLNTDTLCVSADALKGAKTLGKRRSEALLIDKKTLQYREPLGVLAIYKFSADGMKMLTLRSYAKSKRKPAYASPVLAMSDNNGCISRVVTGYFQSRYEPTKATHSMLQGAVNINTDEPYLLLISSEHKNDRSSYSQSLYGQLSIKWQP